MNGRAYRHTQVGYLTLIVVLGVAVGIVAIPQRAPRPITIGVAALIVIIGVLFSSLTVEVDDGELRLHFGLGFWRKEVPLAEVAAVNATTSSWWEGWGIRITPRGMLYNVSGMGAVEIQLRSGQRFRIGTDEPEVLAEAVRIASPSRSNG